MGTNYPIALDNLVNPGPDDYMHIVEHDDQHANANDAIEALESTVGISSNYTFLKRDASNTATALAISGLTGAALASRYVGATAGGKPTAGTFAVGDYIIDQGGYIWICTVAGTPGTWVSPARGTLGYAQVTANQTGIGGSDTDLTGLTATVTVGTNRRILVTGHILAEQKGGAGTAVGKVKEGATTHGRFGTAYFAIAFASGAMAAGVPLTPTAGAHTYKLTLITTANTVDLVAAADIPAYIRVDDIGGV